MMRGLNSAICVMTSTAFITLSLSSVWADNLPRAVGQCRTTTIKQVGSRLEGMPDSGSAVSYANGAEERKGENEGVDGGCFPAKHSPRTSWLSMRVSDQPC